MEWISQFDLFLFDLDGLLVNTEELHYRAYKQMCEDQGFDLQWSFTEYCLKAHGSGKIVLENEIYSHCKGLKDKEPQWSHLYAEKTRHLIALLEGGAIHLMPGAFELLNMLNKANKRYCVVTHSKDVFTKIIRQKNPLLDEVPLWITREHYSLAKPDPEGYLKAIELIGRPGDRIVGFEDSIKGVEALLQTPSTCYLVTDIPHQEIPQLVSRGVRHVDALTDIYSG